MRAKFADDPGGFAAALLPAAAVGVFYFGMPALAVLVTSTAGCVAFAALSRLMKGREIAVSDGRRPSRASFWA